MHWKQLHNNHCGFYGIEKLQMKRYYVECPILLLFKYFFKSVFYLLNFSNSRQRLKSSFSVAWHQKTTDKACGTDCRLTHTTAKNRYDMSQVLSTFEIFSVAREKEPQNLVEWHLAVGWPNKNMRAKRWRGDLRNTAFVHPCSKTFITFWNTNRAKTW